jgi:hypothetical protein
MAMDGKYGGNTEGRDAKGHFSTGNPGKPRGARHRATQAALALLSGEAEGLKRKAVELALAGDVTALRLCLERLVPPCREAPISLDLPRLQTRAEATAASPRLFTCCGPCAMLACRTNATACGFLMVARVYSVARHWLCAFSPRRR